MNTDKINHFLPHTQLQDLLDALQQAGFSCVGPQVRDGTIVYDILSSAKQLPWGIRAHQSPGEYRLETLNEHKAFSWANGPQAIKPILFKPSETVWRVARNSDGKLEFNAHAANEEPVAIMGARACDLAAMAIQDKVFLSEDKTDVRYQNRRESLFIVAVNCTYSSSNCFCVSAGTGPNISQPFDILMTELDDGFVVKSGSERGQTLLATLKLQHASNLQCNNSIQDVEKAAQMQTWIINVNYVIYYLQT